MNLNAIVWLTWRQHRWSIVGATALALGAASAFLSTEAERQLVGSLMLPGFYAIVVQLAFGCVIGVLWGAPLIARELEERTYFVAWGQDVTPVQWLRGKVIVLGLLAVVLGAVIGLGDGVTGDQAPTWGAFEANPAVQAGYALFGLALGVLTGLLTRHVVTAMAATLVFYTLVRVLTSVVVRDHLLPAERAIARWDSKPRVPPGAQELGGGFVDSRLDAVAVTAQCQRINPGNPGNCMASSKAAVGTYVDYQPADRIGLFQFLECGLFVVLALALFAVAFRILRRGGGWKPSRSHRRFPVQSAPETAAAQAEG